MNYYEHHLGDWIRDTVGLTAMEEGLYRRLVDAYYIGEAPLPADKAECYRLARANTAAERKATDYVLGKYFRLSNDGHRQERCDREIARFADKREKAKASSALGVAARVRNAEGKTERTTERLTDGQPLQSPVTRHQGKEPPASRVPPAEAGRKATRRCPAEFLVSTELQRWARTDCPLVDIRAETATFRDFEFKTAHSDWPATWKNWMRKEQKRLRELGDRDQKRGGVTDIGFGLETPRQRANRERIAEMTGGLASQQPSRPLEPALPTFDEELDGIARIAG